ncbi:hypothetical protein H4R35_000465 [Dimargaris xerosporica]|nr:hypothetical protein H4R35_000465 [Dimargaris xerosporica]
MASHLHQIPTRNAGPEMPPPVRALFTGTATTPRATESRRPVEHSQPRSATSQRHDSSRQLLPTTPGPKMPGSTTQRPWSATAGRAGVLAWPTGYHQASPSMATPRQYQRSVAASQRRYPTYDYHQWAQSLRYTVDRVLTSSKPLSAQNSAGVTRSTLTTTQLPGVPRPRDRGTQRPSLFPASSWPNQPSEPTENQGDASTVMPTPTDDDPVTVLCSSESGEDTPRAGAPVLSATSDDNLATGSVASEESGRSSTATYNGPALTALGGDKALAIKPNNTPFDIAADVAFQLGDLPESWFSQLESTIEFGPELTFQISGANVATVPAYAALPAADTLTTNANEFMELANDLSWLQALPEATLADSLNAEPAHAAHTEGQVSLDRTEFGVPECSTRKVPSVQCDKPFPMPGPSVAASTSPSLDLNHAQLHMVTPEPRTRRLSASSAKSTASSAGSCRCGMDAGEVSHTLYANPSSPYFLRSHCRSHRCKAKVSFPTQPCSPTTQHSSTVTRPSHPRQENTGPSAQPSLPAPVAPRRKKSRRSRRRRVILPVTAPEHPSRDRSKTNPSAALPTGQPMSTLPSSAIPNVPLSYELRNRTVQPPPRLTKRSYPPETPSGNNPTHTRLPSLAHKSRKRSRLPSTTGVASRLRSRTADQ